MDDIDVNVTQEGLKVALDIKQSYNAGNPICIPGNTNRLLIPENLLNDDLNLNTIDDPLPLAMMAARDPEPPMSIAATTRLGPKGRSNELVSGVIRVVGETSKHTLVRECISLIMASDFNVDALSQIRYHAKKFILQSRQQYAESLKENLRNLMDGSIAPRKFVLDFFELTEAGNLRHDIRKRLILTLLLSENVRPSVKFILLENLERMPKPIRVTILTKILRAKPAHHIDLLKEEIKWIISPDFCG